MIDNLHVKRNRFLYDQEEVCVICMTEYQEDDDLIELPCKAKYLCLTQPRVPRAVHPPVAQQEVHLPRLPRGHPQVLPGHARAALLTFPPSCDRRKPLILKF